MVKTESRGLDEDFEIFARGVERLEELKRELGKLDTKGFEKEANSIKKKLTNISFIPQIEKEIRVLKAKITQGQRGVSVSDYSNFGELNIQNQLQRDLDLRKKEFELKYRILEVKFAKKYDDKIKLELEKKIKNEFEKALKERIEGLKANLVKKANLKLKEEKLKLKLDEKKKLAKIDLEKQKISDNFSAQIAKKIKEEERKFSSFSNIQGKLEARKEAIKSKEEKSLANILRGKEKLKNKIIFGNQRILVIRKKEAEVSLSRKELRDFKKQIKQEFQIRKNKLIAEHRTKLNSERKVLRREAANQIFNHETKTNSKMDNHLLAEMKKLHNEYELKKSLEENRINRIKNQLEQERNVLFRLKNQIIPEMRRIKENTASYKKKLTEKLEKQKQKEIDRVVKSKSAVVKRQLNKEFKRKLDLMIEIKKRELMRRK